MYIERLSKHTFVYTYTFDIVGICNCWRSKGNVSNLPHVIQQYIAIQPINWTEGTQAPPPFPSWPFYRFILVSYCRCFCLSKYDSRFIWFNWTGHPYNIIGSLSMHGPVHYYTQYWSIDTFDCIYSWKHQRHLVVELGMARYQFRTVASAVFRVWQKSPYIFFFGK